MKTLRYALLVIGFVLLAGFFVSWYLVAAISKWKKRKLKKTYFALWGAGIPLALGGLAMIIIGLLLK